MFSRAFKTFKTKTKQSLEFGVEKQGKREHGDETLSDSLFDGSDEVSERSGIDDEIVDNPVSWNENELESFDDEKDEEDGRCDEHGENIAEGKGRATPEPMKIVSEDLSFVHSMAANGPFSRTLSEMRSLSSCAKTLEDRLLKSDLPSPDVRMELKRIGEKLSGKYWNLLFDMLSIKTSSNPERLEFTPDERLFVDYGFLGVDITPTPHDFRDRTPMYASLDLEREIRSSGQVFSCLLFSDFISECWAEIVGGCPPISSIGTTDATRISAMREAYTQVCEKRRERLHRLAETTTVFGSDFSSAVSSTSISTPTPDLIANNLDQNVFSFIRVEMRLKSYREAPERDRERMAKERFLYSEAESGMNFRLETLINDPGRPIPLKDIEDLLQIHDMAWTLAMKILYVEVDTAKTERRYRRRAEECATYNTFMRQNELKNVLAVKKEYLAVPAKAARMTASTLCPSDIGPHSCEESIRLLETMCAYDIAIFAVARVRMYGIPRVIFVPGQGIGTYDWRDHTLLLPLYPKGNVARSCASALAAFRWDGDEDRVVKNPYSQLKEHRKKSVVALAESFKKDYVSWMTRERLGYRVLPRDTHNVFKRILSTNSRSVNSQSSSV